MNFLMDIVHWFQPNYHAIEPIYTPPMREAIQAKSEAADELTRQLRRMEEVVRK